MKNKFISALLVLCLSALLFACAKKEVQVGTKTFDASKTYTIAIAQSAEKETLDSMRSGLVIGMKDLGYLEDVNLKYVYENAKNNVNFAGQIADNFSESDADVIVTIGNATTIAMCEKEKEKPIVFIGVGDADRLGLTSNYENVTGVIDSHLVEERLNFINVNYPDVKRIGIIFNAEDKLAQYDVDYFKFVATAYDIDIYTVSIKRTEDIGKALDNIMPKVDAIALVTDFMIDEVVDDIVDRAKTDGKIVFGDTDEHMKKGAEVLTSRDYQLVGKKGAEIIDKILKGEKAKDIKAEVVNFRVN